MKQNNIDNIYKIIVENLGEEIFVSDGNGDVLFVNPASIEINALDIENIIGRNVQDLQNEGYFSESSTLKVLREKQPVSVLQKLKNGKRIIASGNYYSEVYKKAGIGGVSSAEEFEKIELMALPIRMSCR